MSTPLVFKRVPATEKLEDLPYAPNEVVIYDSLPAEVTIVDTKTPEAPEKPEVKVKPEIAALALIQNPTNANSATIAKKVNQIINALKA